MRAQELGKNMAGLQCFGCGQEFGFFRREVSVPYLFLLWGNLNAGLMASLW